MAHDRARPGFGNHRGAEQRFLFFQSAHHEITRLQPPIDVPLSRLVAVVQEQCALRLAPSHGKLILLGEVADASEVEHHDRLQRVLPCHAQCAVIDQLHQTEESHHRRHGQAMYAPRIGAAITAFGRSKTPNAHSASASTCTGTRSGASRSAAAKTIAAASNQEIANSTSRQMIPTRTKAGGSSANSASTNATRVERRATANARRPKPSQ